MLIVFDLTTNHIREPRGLVGPITFSWRLAADGQDVHQEAWQVRVVPRGLKDPVWDSGRHEGCTRDVAYEGPELESGGLYEWSVTVWSDAGEHATSLPATFGCGKLDGAWEARWVESTIERRPCEDVQDPMRLLTEDLYDEHPEDTLSPTVTFATTFSIPEDWVDPEVHGNVSQATAYVTAHGNYALTIDGAHAGEPLAPGYTVYDRHMEVQAIDVLGAFPSVTAGLERRLRVEVADGWYLGHVGLVGIGEQYGSVPALFCQLDVVFEDGFEATVAATDETWVCKVGPTRYADLFVGERRDEPWAAELPDAWQPVRLAPYGTEMLRGTEAAPVRCIRTITPKAFQTPGGDWVLDAGANVVGVTEIAGAAAQAGREVRLEHTEELDRDGNFYRSVRGQHKEQTDVYVPASDGPVSWVPAFTYHGFRYVRVSGLDAVRGEDFRIRVLATDLERAGRVTTSHELLNQLLQNVYRSQEGNMVSIPTDCPQREKAGWTGDMQVFASTAPLNMDVYAFLRKWLHQMRLAQTPAGEVPDTVPWIPSNSLLNGERMACAGWGDCCVVLPWELWRAYGRREVLEENLPMMEAWMTWAEGQVEASDADGVWDHGFQYGDWLVPSQAHLNPMEAASVTAAVSATAMLARSADLMVAIERELGHDDQVARFEGLRDRARDAFVQAFVEDDGAIRGQAGALQGPYVLALACGCVQGELAGRVAARLAELVHAAGDVLDTGFLATPLLLDALWDAGERELAWKLLFQTKAPSWLYEVEQGATTVWERWLSILPDGTRTPTSYNHFALGSVESFVWRRIVGLEPLEPGLCRVRVAPDLTCGLTRVNASLLTPQGEVTVSWRVEEGHARLAVTLPPDTSGVLVWGDETREVGPGDYVMENDLAS